MITISTNQIKVVATYFSGTIHQVTNEVFISKEDISTSFENKFPSILSEIEEERMYVLTPKKTNLIKQLVAIHNASSLSIGQVAIRASIDKSYISRLLNEKISNPGRDQIIRLCAWGWKIDFARTNELLHDAGYEQLW